VLLILLVVYRNLITMLVPLVTIGISLATAQGVLSGAAELGLGISSQTIVFMSAIIFAPERITPSSHQPLPRLRPHACEFGRSG